jgi:hypothetical protein
MVLAPHETTPALTPATLPGQCSQSPGAAPTDLAPTHYTRQGRELEN